MRKLVCLSALLSMAAGCSTASRDVTAAQVSPMPYEAYACEQLSAEGERIRARAAELAARLDKAAENDRKLVVASLLFLPTLFAIGGTKDEEAEYARLKGEHAALRQVASRKGCPS
jgi:hypothetical protein